MGEHTTAPGDERLCQVADDTEAGNGVRAVSLVHLQPVQASQTSMWSISVSSNKAAAWSHRTEAFLRPGGVLTAHDATTTAVAHTLVANLSMNPVVELGR